MTFILIQIKFDIDIDNDELLETIWKQKKKNVDCHWLCIGTSELIMDQ
jgi:hypothetical protein